jgi:hypothetical protein
VPGELLNERAGPANTDIAFPEYFAALGIRYRRTGTPALGQRCCDFRLERNA